VELGTKECDKTDLQIAFAKVLLIGGQDAGQGRPDRQLVDTETTRNLGQSLSPINNVLHKKTKITARVATLRAVGQVVDVHKKRKKVASAARVIVPGLENIQVT